MVKYEGRGAYFLDKLQEGVWRLEVMPDAILVSEEDPLYIFNAAQDHEYVVGKWLPGLHKAISSTMENLKSGCRKSSVLHWSRIG